jgi:hypothetical protein
MNKLLTDEQYELIMEELQQMVDEIKKLCQQYFNLQKDLQKEERKVEK